MVLRAWVLLMLALCADASRARAQSAEPAQPLRVLVRLQDPRDQELLTRLRGQTSDLPVALESASAERAPGPPKPPAETAFAPCATHAVDALVAADWSEAQEPSVWITLATCRDRRLFSRQVQLEAGAGSSGLMETCALVLRSALSVLSLGGSIGVQVQAGNTDTPRSAKVPTLVAPAPVSAAQADSTTPDAASAVRASEPVAPVAASAAVPPARMSPVPRAQPKAPLQVYGALGLQEAWDGASARGQPAIQASFALGGNVQQLALTGQVGLPIELRDAYTRIVLSRHGVALGWRVNAWRRGAWRLRGAIDLGAALYQRSVQAESSQAHPRESKLAIAPVLAGSLELQRALGPVWLALGVGVDGMLRVPQFVYQSASGQRDALTLWPLVPRLFVALAWESS